MGYYVEGRERYKEWNWQQTITLVMISQPW